MNKLRRIQPPIAYLALVSYVFCTLAAYRRFPGTFSPIQNWLSDLGDIYQNPNGAIFYNLGICLTGLMVLLFFLSISQWRMKNRRIQTSLVLATQVFGVLGGTALILSAVFPISRPQEHQIASIALYILLGTAFAFSVTDLRYQPGFPKWVMAVGVITAIVDMLSGIFQEVTILEWLTVALFLTYLVILSNANKASEGWVR